MIDIFRMLATLQRQRSEIADEAVAEIIRIHAYNRKMVEHGVKIKRIIAESITPTGLSLEATNAIRSEVYELFREDGQ